MSENVLCHYVAQEALKHTSIKTYLSSVCHAQIFRAVWQQAPRDANNIMLWVACTMCFFGFLRVGEIAVPSSQSYDAGAHLSVADVTLDNREQPSLVQVTIKVSKTDPFRKGVVIFMGKTQQIQLYLHIWQFVVPLRALSLPSRKTPHCPGSCSWQECDQLSQLQVYKDTNLLGIASESEQHPLLQLEGSKILLLRPWDDGEVLHTCYTFGSRGNV